LLDAHLFTIMSKQAFEEANEVFVDDKYEEAYEVRNEKNVSIVIQTKSFVF
jgi:hypothetical protein